jgi:hypothetical protein
MTQSGEQLRQSVMIALSPAQVDQVVRAASDAGSMSVLLSGLDGAREALYADPARFDDRRLSRSLLAGLLMLACFPPDGSYLANAEVARTVQIHPSTVHRYLATFVAVGLVERDSRLYRLAQMSQAERPTQGPLGPTESPVRRVSEALVVSIDLSDAQVAQVVRSTSEGSGLVALLAGLGGEWTLRDSVTLLLDDPRYSRSFLLALLVLNAFPVDGSERELTGVAADLEVPAGTTHRYVGTWMAVGLLEQDPASRRYRRALLRTEACPTR